MAVDHLIMIDYNERDVSTYAGQERVERFAEPRYESDAREDGRRDQEERVGETRRRRVLHRRTRFAAE